MTVGCVVDVVSFAFVRREFVAFATVEMFSICTLFDGNFCNRTGAWGFRFLISCFGLLLRVKCLLCSQACNNNNMSAYDTIFSIEVN